MLKTIIKFLAGIAAVAGLWWIVGCRCIDLRQFSPAAIRDYIRGFGALSALVYVLLYALNTVCLVPPIGILSLAAGLIFGKTWGAVVLMAGAMLGTSATFFISRFFGRGFIEKIMAVKLRNLDDMLAKKGFATVLFFRVIPLVPFEVLNYAAGLSRIRFREYCLATFLGLIPGVIISAFLGGRLGEIGSFRDLFSFKFLCALTVLIILVFVPLAYKRLNKKGASDAR